MLLIIVEISPKNGIFSLKKAFQLASIITNRKDVSFIVEDREDTDSFFKGRGFKYYIDPEPRKIFKDDISAILFFKDKLSGKDKKILTRARKRGIHTIKFSYMGANPADCDVIIDPSPATYNSSDEKREILSGLEYTVIHNKYIHFHSLKRKYNNKLRTILLSVGDVFHYRELRKLTETLINRQYNVKIIPGKNFKKFNRKTLKRIYPGLKISGTPESHARSYFESDLAIIDPEYSAVSAASTGTPAIYIPQSDNGDSTASYFEENGAGIIFRRRKQENYSEMIELLKFFSPEKRENFGNAGKTLVDGKGVYRIAELLTIRLNT